LTGTIGSGKSTALSCFSRQGWHVVRTDDLAREILDLPEQRSAVRRRWGDGVLNEDGSLNRSRIGGIVFNDSKELDWLEELVHPLVRARWMEIVQENREHDVVVEIPLLFEKNLASHFDFVVSVNCTEHKQLSRLQAKGLTVRDIEARRGRQFPGEVKDAKADFVLCNCGTIPFLEKQVTRLSRHLRETRKP